MSSVAEALRAAHQQIGANEARLLLGHVVGQSLTWLIAHDDSHLSAAQLADFSSLCARRRRGEPIAYLTSHREFYGRAFVVGPGVLIPRPETELLVDIAKQEIAVRVGVGKTAVRVLDLGTGSACIAISIALEYRSENLTVLGIDTSAQALAIARTNAERLNAPVRFVESNWFSALSGECVDLIVSNPPYIAEHDPHLSQGDLVYEPATALVSGPDGLDAIRIIVRDAADYLRPGGCLCLEHGHDQADAVHNLLQANGYHAIEQHLDIAGIVRVTRSVWPG